MAFRKHRILAAASAAALAVVAMPTMAAQVVVPLPDFNGPVNSTGFPIDLGVVGTFIFALPPGANITSATIGGTYGTALFSTSTAGFDIDVDGTVVTGCAPLAATCWATGAPLRAFSVALPSSGFAALLDGQAALRIIQTNQTVVRYGSPTLTIDYNMGGAVPEPASWAMMIAGFGMIGGAMRRRQRQQARVAYA